MNIFVCCIWIGCIMEVSYAVNLCIRHNENENVKDLIKEKSFFLLALLIKGFGFSVSNRAYTIFLSLVVIIYGISSAIEYNMADIKEME